MKIPLRKSKMHLDFYKLDTLCGKAYTPSPKIVFGALNGTKRKFLNFHKVYPAYKNLNAHLNHCFKMQLLWPCEIEKICFTNV